MRKSIVPAALVLVVVATGSASAQSTAWGKNGYVSFNGIYQDQTMRFDDRTVTTIEHEPASISAGHVVKPGPTFDISTGGRLKGNLGFGFGVSFFRRNASADVVASLPHPFYFNQPRNVTGSATGLRHEELAVHTQMMWLVPMSENFQAVVSGGPTYFKLEEAMASNIKYSESYPFDTAAFDRLETTEHKASKVGFNLGAEVSYFFSRYVGITGLVRLSRATVDMPADDGSEVPVKVGGTHMGAGLRFRF